MKTTLTLILLSILLPVGFTSCTQSEENKEINEIKESIEQTNQNERIRKAIEDISKKVAASKEREQKALEQWASTPEGREEMRKALLRLKHTYEEDDHLIFKLTPDEALKIGFFIDEYNQIIKDYAIFNHRIDSINALRKPNTERSPYHVNRISSYDQARNGTHKYYQYLKKYQAEDAKIPTLNER